MRASTQLSLQVKHLYTLSTSMEQILQMAWVFCYGVLKFLLNVGVFNGSLFMELSNKYTKIFSLHRFYIAIRSHQHRFSSS